MSKREMHDLGSSTEDRKKSRKDLTSYQDPSSDLARGEDSEDSSQSDSEKLSQDHSITVTTRKDSRKGHTVDAAEIRAAREASETFRSNVFKLQVDEVLKEITVDEKYASQARKFLFTLREKIANTTAFGPVAYSDAQKSLTTRIPFPRESILAVEQTEIKYKFAYVPPKLESINVVGSWSLHSTVRRPAQPASIDLLVPMDANLFDSKDFLDFRYHRKRAFFIAVLASQLAEAGLPLEPRFENFNGNPLRPTLLLIPTGQYHKLGKKIIVYVHACPEKPANIPLARLAPHKNANRSVDGPTPVYNWSILSDICAMPVLRYLHSTAATAHSFVDAVKLGALWLHQRQWGSDTRKGGFGVFEFSILIAALLNESSKNGKKRLLPGYSSYQLFKGALMYIAEARTISLRPRFEKKTKDLISENETPGIIFIDTGLNVLANMAPWAPELLRHDAQLSVDMLNDSTRDRFQSLFLRDCSEIHLRFDTTFGISFKKGQLTNKNPSIVAQEIYNVLRLAWGRRYRAMRIVPAAVANQGSLQSSWPLSSDVPDGEAEEFLVCAILNPDSADKRVTFLENDIYENSESFNSFWGSKASLRRFQDGAIKDAVVWTPSPQPVVIEAAVYSLRRHLDAHVKVHRMLEIKLPSNSGIISDSSKMFMALSTSFQKLGQILQELRGTLPLRILSVYGTSSDLRHASIKEPQPFVPSQISEGIIEMESSNRWPAELEATEKVKSAFLIKIAETMRKLHPQYHVVIGLEPSPEDPTIEGAFAIIQSPDGFYYKLRIYARTSKVSESKLSLLADHTRLISTMVNRFPGTLSTAMRLVKYWLERQMLMSYVSEPAAELLTLHTFLNSSPWAPPVSPTTAFWRTLDLIKRWDWHESGLILDVDRHTESVEHHISQNQLVTGCDMNYELFQSMTASFAKQRKQDPALTQAPWVISTALDVSGINWTAWQPRSRLAAVIAARITALANLAKPNVSLFSVSLSDFDVAWVVTAATTKLPKNKNVVVSDPHKAIIGAYNVAQDLVHALIKLYSDSLVLFYSPPLDSRNRETSSKSQSSHLLCGVWNAQALEKVSRLKANTPFPLRKVQDHYELDKEALLLEVERLGYGMLRRIK